MEEWRDVVGYEGRYQVSSLGRVWSALSNKYLKLVLGNHGYLVVGLHKNRKQTTACVHILVLEAFVGPCPPGMEACHGLEGSLVNTVVNLSWGTHSKNNGEDKVRDGKHNRGERKGGVKLTSNQVKEIRQRYVPGVVTLRQLADEYGVSFNQIRRIVKRFEWVYE